MPFVKIIKNKAYFKRFQVKYPDAARVRPTTALVAK
jgi:hypothetical protein